MVYVTKRWRCEKCRKGYSSYDQARDCEFGHITQAAIDGFKDDLDEIFGRKVNALAAAPQKGEG